MLKTHTKRGEVTRYGLACGYVETFEYGPYHASLSMEHGTIMIRGIDSKGRFFKAFDQQITMERVRTTWWIAKDWIKKGWWQPAAWRPDAYD